MTDIAEVVDSPQTTDLSQVSTDDLRNQLTTPPEAPATEEVMEEQSPEPQPEQVAEETPQAEVETQEVVETETEEERLAKRRVRPRSELDQQVIDLYRSEGFSGSFADASRVIFGQTESTPQANRSAEAETPDPFSNYNAVEAKLSQEITQLETEVVKAADELETSKALELQRQIMKRELELQGVKGRKEREVERQQQAIEDTQRSKALESRDRAIQAYPDLGDKSSVYRKEFDDFISQTSKNPDYNSIFESPNWCELMAHTFASQKGYQQPQPAQVPQAPPVQAPAVGTQTKVLTTGNTAQPINAPVNADRVRQDMSQMSKEDLFSLLGTDDNRRHLR